MKSKGLVNVAHFNELVLCNQILVSILTEDQFEKYKTIYRAEFDYVSPRESLYCSSQGCQNCPMLELGICRGHRDQPDVA